MSQLASAMKTTGRLDGAIKTFQGPTLWQEAGGVKVVVSGPKFVNV
jgi:hypothetical protein